MAPKKGKHPNAEKSLRAVFYNAKHPGSYGGVDSTHYGIKKKFKRGRVRDWLTHQDTYTLHKPAVRNFLRRRVVVGSIDQQFQADLVDVSKLAKFNNGYRYLLTCIDVLSKFAFVVPLRDKTGKTLVEAFKVIFASGRKCKTLQTDKGTEFTNRVFQKFLKDNDVDFFTTHNEETKASIAERFNRTLKTKMWKYFTANDTVRYVDVLDDLVWSYNHSYHRSIKTSPASVTQANQEKVWQTLYGQPLTKRKKHSFLAGDRVRMTMAKRPFKKGYLPSWSEELFTVVKQIRSYPTTYKVQDDHGDVLEGSFYDQELQKVADKDVYKIERILSTRKRKKKKEYLVKWAGYPDSFNSWILESQLQTYNM